MSEKQTYEKQAERDHGLEAPSFNRIVLAYVKMSAENIKITVILIEQKYLHNFSLWEVDTHLDLNMCLSIFLTEGSFGCKKDTTRKTNKQKTQTTSKLFPSVM